MTPEEKENEVSRKLIKFLINLSSQLKGHAISTLTVGVPSEEIRNTFESLYGEAIQSRPDLKLNMDNFFADWVNSHEDIFSTLGIHRETPTAWIVVQGVRINFNRANVKGGLQLLYRLA